MVAWANPSHVIDPSVAGLWRTFLMALCALMCTTVALEQKSES
jgi:hypothetical protein